MAQPNPAADRSPEAAGDVHELRVGRRAMACLFEIVFNAGEYPDATPIAVEALDLVDRIEERLTVYRGHGEVMGINERAAREPVRVGADLMQLLQRARELYDLTGGGFDIASGRLVRTWGFLAGRGATPTDAVLAEALARSGMDHVELDPAASTVRLRRDGVEINLGSIGKGWAVDLAVELLARRGIGHVLVHGGQSSVRALGNRRSAIAQAGWPVGLQHPLRPGVRLAHFRLRNAALGTSGSGTRFFVEEGRRIGHILDPRSGRPAEGVLSATVVAPTAADADALATAAYVLGADELGRIAAPGGPVGAILVEPAASRAAVRVVRANLGEEVCRIEPIPGVEIVDRD